MGKVEVFYTSRKELNRRFDPFCYIPELTYLEKQIKSKTSYTLSDFTLFRASGSTPSKSNNTLYSDKDNGIPFVRVQNLSTTGELDQSDMVYISKNTHEGLLKRSQVREYDLLVKITGVGRMAITSVAPKGFVGNINQHIVVIRTGSKEISENIATFLNLDIIERLASKRATGGTRPALDYSALFSIPIINDRMFFDIMHGATRKKKQKEEKAQELLGSIDDYLLGELGIKLPEQKENTIQNRIFFCESSKVASGRFDPKPYNRTTQSLRFAIDESAYPLVTLKDLIIDTIAGNWGKDITNKTDIDFTKCLVVRATEFDNTFNLDLDNSRLKYRLISNTKLTRMNIHEGDLLIEKSGGSPDQPVGRVALLNKNVLSNNSVIAYSNFIQKISIDWNKVIPEYLFCFLKTIYNVGITESMQNQTNGIRNLIMTEYYNQNIPLPPLAKQTEIANHITAIRNKAKRLQEEATKQFEDAKQKVEKIILGE